MLGTRNYFAYVKDARNNGKVRAPPHVHTYVRWLYPVKTEYPTEYRSSDNLIAISRVVQRRLFPTTFARAKNKKKKLLRFLSDVKFYHSH